MAKIHDGLAGRRQILLGHLVKPPASAHDEAGAEQSGQMFGGIVVTATAHLRHFVNRPRLAAAQFLEHFPSRGVAQCGDEQFQVRQRRSNGSFRRFRG